jgi:putative NADH-flavin reductase
MSKGKKIGLFVVLLMLGTAAVIARLPATARGLTPGNSAAAPPLTGETASVPLKILVIGGTRGTGRAVVELAAARGHAVTAVARNPPEDAFTDGDIKFVAGNVMDPPAVALLATGQDVVVSAISTSPTRQRVEVYSKGASNILAASPAEQPLRLIAVTGIGAGDSRGHGGFFYDSVIWPLLLKSAYEDKDREEAIIREGRATWTIVRPGFLTDDEMTGDYRVVNDTQAVRSGSISRKDVAHFIVAALETGSFARETVLLTH